jgi:hypothetical protein
VPVAEGHVQVYQLFTILVPRDLEEIDARICARSRRILLPRRWHERDFPVFERLGDVSTSEFVWWLPEISPRYRVEQGPKGGFRISRGSEVLRCRWTAEPRGNGGIVLLEYDDATEIEPYLNDAAPGRWEPASAGFLDIVLDVRDALTGLCSRGAEGMWCSKRAASGALPTPEPAASALPVWRSDTAQRAKHSDGGRRGTLGYAASFALVRELAGLDGEPRPRVRRRPGHGDEVRGPSWFKTSVVGVNLERIRLPGLYVGQSEVAAVSFSGAKLYRSALNWSDFREVSFRDCDLHDSDLRACVFAGCDFGGARLAGCDLRGSSFEGCDFAGAQLDGAVLLREEEGVALTAAQRAVVGWTDEYDDPAGG